MPILKLLKSLFTFHMMYVVDPDAPAAVVVPPKAEPTTFSSDYVRELREENKAWRLKHADAEKLASDSKLSADAATKAAKDSVDAATIKSNDRIIRAELKAAAIAAGMIDLDGLKLADLTKVTLKEDGSVDGADVMLTELKTAKPYLFGVPNTSSTPTTPPANKPPEAKKATEMTAEEYAVARKQFK